MWTPVLGGLRAAKRWWAIRDVLARSRAAAAPSAVMAKYGESVSSCRQTRLAPRCTAAAIPSASAAS
jgi:hypothetical protein